MCFIRVFPVSCQLSRSAVKWGWWDKDFLWKKTTTIVTWFFVMLYMMNSFVRYITHFHWETSFPTFIDAELKNQEMECNSSKRSSYVLIFPSSRDRSVWNLMMTRNHRNWDYALLHGPTDPRKWCHFILQPGFLKTKFAGGLIVSTVVK